MSIERCEELYLLIGNKANEIIPTKWSKILLYAEVVPGVVTNHYCFYEAESGNLVEFASIPQKYGIDRNELKHSSLELTRLIRQLHTEWDNSNQEKWTTMTFELESDGQFNIDYGYENLEETDVVFRRKEWEKKYLHK